MSDQSVMVMLASPSRGRGQPPTTLESLFARTLTLPTGCIVWTGGKQHGYGRVSIGGKLRRVHKVFYELFVGPIPAGMVLDHRCHNEDQDCPGGPNCIHRSCMNVAHLEPVVQRVNVYRGKGLAAVNAVKNACSNGHEFDARNTAPRLDAPNGGRRCRRCSVKATQRYRERKGRT